MSDREQVISDLVASLSERGSDRPTVASQFWWVRTLLILLAAAAIVLTGNFIATLGIVVYISICLNIIFIAIVLTSWTFSWEEETK